MNKFYSYINSAREILALYNGNEPFATFLKKYFSGHKKFGSRDRKQVSHICYCYFRMGRMLPELPIEDKILVALFLCSEDSNEILQALKPHWNEKISLSIREKCALINDQCSVSDVFPWREELSDGVDLEEFYTSFLIQPDVFVRLRQGHESWVREKLIKAGMPFKDIDQNCISLQSGSKIDNVLALDYEAMIQDLNSQQTGQLMKLAVEGIAAPYISAWDCCAGSGGKSLMLFDIKQQLELTVSDVRETIISNLKKRFKEHGVSNYHTIVADLTKETPKFKANSKFDLIIADVPCTGSGTWARTPEQLFFFDRQSIEKYSERQRKIVSSAVRSLNPGGYLLYITCSVFKKENEENAPFIQQQLQLEPIKIELLKGYDKKADSMYAALFKKPL